jgi:hypothetical protein
MRYYIMYFNGRHQVSKKPEKELVPNRIRRGKKRPPTRRRV